MNIFDDERTDRIRTECQHIWILKDDGTVYCYDCKTTTIMKEEVSK